MRLAIVSSLLALLVAACGEPNCPDGSHYVHPRCVRVDAGTDGSAGEGGVPTDGGDDAGVPTDGSPADAATCADTLCDGDCVDTTTDARHCGECGNSCSGLVCMDGECADVVVQVALGPSHSCALKAGGTVHCWGANDTGQLGDGTFDGSPVPKSVVGIDDASFIAAGGALFGGLDGVTCAIRSDRSVWCWGFNNLGQLGNGTTDNSNEPVRVTGLSDATHVAVGDSTVCAVRSGGTVVCWGSGHGETPVAVAGVGDAVSVDLSISHKCALDSAGAIYCWGSNEYGQLGDGTTDAADVIRDPVRVTSVADAQEITVGANHTCALRPSLDVECWGQNFFGALGTALPPGDGHRVEPAPVDGLPEVMAVYNQLASNCALSTARDLWCWGVDIPAAADGTEAELRSAERVGGVADVRDASVGLSHACAILSDGSVACWGSNANGRLGDGTTMGSASPVLVVGLP